MADLNLGSVSFAEDPYQIKVLRPLLEQAGLWRPEWNDWAAAGEYNGEGSSGWYGAPPDFSSLDGYGAGFGDYGSGNRYEAVTRNGQEVAGRSYFYDEPSMGEQMAQGALIVGGSALGMNALFGGLGGLGGGVGAGLGGAEAGIGTLGTIAPGSGALAPIGAAGAGGTAGLQASMAALNAAALPAAPSALGGWAAAGAGAAGGLGGMSGGMGAWNGVDFSGAGGNSLLGSLTSGNGLANLAQAGLGMYGQSQALKAAQNATNQSNEFNRYAFDTIRGDNKPLVDLRNSVLPQIQGLLSNPGSITSDPGYQFQFGEGQKALNNGAAARGMTYSGAQGKALQRYGNDFASTKLDQSLNRLTNAAGLGQVGANSNNQATQNYANNQSENALNMGQARGSVYGNMANIGGNALSRIFNPYQYDQLNRRGD